MIWVFNIDWSTLPGFGWDRTLTGCYFKFLKHTRVSFVIKPACLSTGKIEKAWRKGKKREEKDQ